MSTRTTKIIATLGPSSRDEGVLRALLEAGANAFRINFSYGRREEHEQAISLVRRLSLEAGRHVAVIQDLQGPKIRVGQMEAGLVAVNAGEHVTLVAQESQDRPGVIPVKYPDLPSLVSAGDRILLGDGEVELAVLSVSGPTVVALAKTSGTIKENQGVTLTDSAPDLPAMTDKDVQDLHDGLRMGVDYVAMSLVRDAEDVRRVKRLIRKERRRVPVIAKLERREAIDALDGILAEADGVMVARGDLGLHFPPEKLPLLQKRIIREANRHGVMVITATQMLESMTRSSRPTRAEATDVANAVLDGTDSVMLSAETAIGEYPVEAVKMMARIVVEAEQEPPARHIDILPPAPAPSMAKVAVQLAEDVQATAIVVVTHSGYSARLMSAERPRVPVLALTAENETARQLALLRGITPVLTDIPRSLGGMLTQAEAKLSRERLLRAGDTVVIARWSQRRGSRWVNFVKLHKIHGEPVSPVRSSRSSRATNCVK
jgi:pyruvate kinase